MKSDLISRSELFNRLADKHTKAEFYQVINDMPVEENTLERAGRIIAGFFDAPCNYAVFNIDVADVMHSEWCDENCDYDTDVAMCWCKLFEVLNGNYKTKHE